MKGWMRVAAVTPRLHLGDPEANADEIVRLMTEADQAMADVVVFPELSLTGATLGDAAASDVILEASEEALLRLAQAALDLDAYFVVGLPIKVQGQLLDAAVVLGSMYSGGAFTSHAPVHLMIARDRFSEEERRTTRRAFTPWDREDDVYAVDGVSRLMEAAFEEVEDPDEVNDVASLTSLGIFDVEASDTFMKRLTGVAVVFPADLDDGAFLDALQEQGVTTLLVPAAEPAYAKSFEKRKAQFEALSRRGFAVVYAGAGTGESGAHTLYAGERLIAEGGAVRVAASALSETTFDPHAASGLLASATDEILYYDLDLDFLDVARREALARRGAQRKTTADTGAAMHARGSLQIEPLEDPECIAVNPSPLVPDDAGLEEILRIQAAGLARRMTQIGAKDVWLGLSGGLDSTLAFLVALRTFEQLHLPLSKLHLVSMPAFGTGKRTRSNARALGEASGADFREILLNDVLKQHFADIGLPEGDRSVAFENAQARERTQIVMDLANLHGGLQVGTGDLSEVALGWSTYNGDHMAMYNPNGSVPKTLARALVAHEATCRPALKEILTDIIQTPISPELLPGEDGAIAQKTEEIVGDYRLHDFFLYYVLKYDAAPDKILALAQVAFAGAFDRRTIVETLRIFARRFLSSQFKRNAQPDGVAVSEVNLSTDGWRMSSDLQNGAWMAALDRLERDQ
ncbi:MAG: NAD(+) synthase [Peptoniphilaceae bacterium]|nr:NAD(+) synthase [Peptoniphilaceae bacterium]